MKCNLVTAVLVTSLALVLPPPPAAAGQEPFRWPEEPKNLKVLDQDVTPSELGLTMGLFVRWLGADCSYCHVGEPGQPLSTYDFASDANPRKDRAREMVRLVRSIEDRLAAIDFGGREAMEVDCATCHRGRPRPVPLATEIVEVYETDGIDAAIAHYRDLKERFHGRGAYDFESGRQLNAAGYRILRGGAVEDAIAVFRLAVEEHPRSSNAYDSLAEAYLTSEDLERSEIFYRKAVELDPDNDHSLEQLLEVRRRLAAGREEAAGDASAEAPPD